MNVKGGAKYRVFVALAIALVAIVLAAGVYANQKRVDKEKIMISELAAIRSSVNLYMALTKTTPESLETLRNATFQSADGNRWPYLAKLSTNAEGKITDPFGTPYQYDRAKAMVWSGTRGYSSW